jgi:predicted metalloprotease
VPGQPKNGSVPLPNIAIPNQQGPTAYQRLVTGVFQHLQVVWSLEMKGLHAKFEPPSKYIPFSAGAGPRCAGEPVGHVNAAYCPDNNSIAWGQTGLTIPFYRDVGVDAVAFVLAHEYGHLIQQDLGIYDDFQYDIERELSADCLAGDFLASVRGTGISFDQSDIRTIERAIFIAGDEPGTPWQNPNAHGSPAQRTHALSVGINDGAAGCVKELAPGFTH